MFHTDVWIKRLDKVWRLWFTIAAQPPISLWAYIRLDPNFFLEYNSTGVGFRGIIRRAEIAPLGLKNPAQDWVRGFSPARMIQNFSRGYKFTGVGFLV